MADKKKQTKAERREAARQARIEAQRRRLRAKRRRQAIVAAVVLVVLLAGGAFAYVRSQAGKVDPRDIETAGCNKVQKLKAQRGEHIDAQNPPPRIPYNTKPPTSGQHKGAGTAPWGIHDEALEPEVYVHNLEHGGIVIHHENLPANQLQDLEDLVDSYPDLGQGTGVILLENKEIDKPLVLTAWARMQKCENYNEKVVRTFIKENCENGPEKFALGC